MQRRVRLRWANKQHILSEDRGKACSLRMSACNPFDSTDLIPLLEQVQCSHILHLLLTQLQAVAGSEGCQSIT
jgi:hypothetical protein